MKIAIAKTSFETDIGYEYELDGLFGFLLWKKHGRDLSEKHESASENQIKFCKYRIVEEPVE